MKFFPEHPWEGGGGGVGGDEKLDIKPQLYSLLKNL